MQQYLTIFSASTPFFLLIGVGFFLRRIQWFSRETDEDLIRILIWILMPALIFDRLLGNAVLKEPANLLVAPVIGALFLCSGYVAARVLSMGWKVASKDKRTFVFTSGSYNYGYIALPLVIELFDASTVGVLFLHNLGYEVALWTVGLMVLRGQLSLKGVMLGVNPVVVSILISVALTLVGADALVPMVARNAFTMAGNCAIPIALLVTGALIYDHLNPKTFFQRPVAGVMACLLRFGIMPIFFLTLVAFIPFTIELKQVLIVQAAMPCAVLPIVLTRKYGGNMPIAVQVVVATSFISILTIPIWIQIGMRILHP